MAFKSLADAWADTTTPHGRLLVVMLGGIADFERRHRARTPDVIDPDDAFAIAVHLLDKPLEILGEFGALGERGDRTQGDFLCSPRRCRQDDGQPGDPQ